MAKSKTVKGLTAKDKELMTQMARTHITTAELAKRHLGYNTDRFKQMCVARLMTKETLNINGKYTTGYVLTQKGIDLIRSVNPSINRIYGGSKTYANHDYGLAELYYKFYDYRNSWRTESDLEGNNRPDAIIIIDGVETALECVTSNYKEADIIAKELHCQSKGWELIKYAIK
ncbi:hypothetical protein ACP26L_17670 [Paenibacillus sp. S-38]|uniref:hypothetical protein n=1 Tax=Paenibacillus sp. S-38 TaxID=3416710 RepID=UPI003CEB1608